MRRERVKSRRSDADTSPPQLLATGLSSLQKPLLYDGGRPDLFQKKGCIFFGNL
jgi:hypothetical protein